MLVWTQVSSARDAASIGKPDSDHIVLVFMPYVCVYLKCWTGRLILRQTRRQWSVFGAPLSAGSHRMRADISGCVCGSAVAAPDGWRDCGDNVPAADKTSPFALPIYTIKSLKASDWFKVKTEDRRISLV